jgi:hypothetical protein
VDVLVAAQGEASTLGRPDERTRMSLTLTLWLTAGLIVLAVAAGWRGARPPDPLRGPRLVPWRMLMALLALCALVLVVHVVNLLGLQTGR